MIYFAEKRDNIVFYKIEITEIPITKIVSSWIGRKPHRRNENFFWYRSAQKQKIKIIKKHFVDK